MANDTIKIKFNVDGADVANRELLEKDRLIKLIEQSAIRLGGALGRVQMDGLRGQSLSALREGVNQFKDMERNAAKAADAIHASKTNVDNLNASLAALGRQQQALRNSPFTGQQALAGNFDVASRDASTRGGGGAGGNASLLAKFSGSAKDIEAATGSVKKLHSEISRVNGVSEIGASLFAQVGVRGGESISLLIRQFSEMGLTFDQLFKNKTFLSIAGLAAAAGIAAITSQMKELNSELLKMTERQANFGFTGSSKKQQSDIAQMKEILDAIDQAKRRVDGGKVDEKGIIGKALGVPDPNVFQNAKKFFNDLPAILGVPTAGISLLIRSGLNAFVGDTEQVIKTRADIAAQLARAEADAARGVEATNEGWIKGVALRHEARRAQEALVKTAQDSFAELLKESEKREEERVKDRAKASTEISKLSLSTEENPIVKLFSDAETKLNSFKESFQKTAPDLVEAYESASKQILQLPIFKALVSGDLVGGTGLRKLEADILRLQNSPGGGEDAGAKTLNQLMLDSRFGRTAAQQAQIDDLSREQSGKALERDIRSREIDALTADLTRTSSLPAERQGDAQRFVLDRLLDATTNIAELSGDQRDQRLKALQQRLALGESERQRVLVQIENNAGDAATVTQDSLGPEPSPDFGNGFFKSFNDVAEQR